MCVRLYCAKVELGIDLLFFIRCFRVDLWRESLYVTILVKVEDAPYSTVCVCAAQIICQFLCFYLFCLPWVICHLFLFILSPLGYLSFTFICFVSLGLFVFSMFFAYEREHVPQCGVLHDAKCCIAHVGKLMLYMLSCGLLVALGTPTVANQLTFPIQNVKLSCQTKSFRDFFKRAK